MQIHLYNLFCLVSLLLYLASSQASVLNPRNNICLRFCIRNKNHLHWKQTICDVKKITKKICHSILSSYYDGQIYYYSLPEEDRELIEQLIHIYF